MLKGSLSIPHGLAKLHPQLTANDLLLIKKLREANEYHDWSELFKDFLTAIGIEIPAQFVYEDEYIDA